MLVFNIVANNLNVIRNVGNDNVISTLVDTGASLPVWVGDLDLFESYFPDCTEDDSETLISGFGKGIEIAPVYRIPEFELSDGSDSIKFMNLLVAVIQRDYSFDMILSFPMLSKANYGYVSYNEMHKPVSPSFYIEPFKDTYYTGTKKALIAERVSAENQKYFKKRYVLEDMYVFTQ